jgi:hypothetical protein
VPGRVEGEKGGAWKIAGLLLLVLAGAGVATWASLRDRAGKAVQADAVCLGCGEVSTVKVGDTPGQEEWPRPCPKCRQKQLYLSRPCPRCGKPLAFKDPAGEKFGQPKECPHCKRDVEGP